jgi:putative membrane protein
VATGSTRQLTEQEKARISEAVRAAERTTRAEIVPMLVARSGLYRDAQHRAGLILALLTLTGLLTGEALWLPWGWHATNAAWLIVAILSAYAVGSWLGTFDAAIRAVTSTERLRLKVKLRAERAFAQQSLFRTRERTGVLLMISLMEHVVYVLPDSGIAAHSAPKHWHEVVEAVVAELKEDDIAGAFCAGIDRCGVILAQAYPATPGDNPDELPNRLVQEP